MSAPQTTTTINNAFCVAHFMFSLHIYIKVSTSGNLPHTNNVFLFMNLLNHQKTDLPKMAEIK